MALVASRVEAWIETGKSTVKLVYDVVASRVEAWIETGTAGVPQVFVTRRLPCGGVD